MEVNRSTLRILHVINSLDPAAGGPPNVLSRLAAAQAGLGHRVTTLSYHDPNGAARMARDQAAIPGFAAVQHIFVSQETGVIGRRLGLQAGRSARAVRDFDVVHIHGVWEPLLRHAAKASRRAGVPYLVAPHGMLDPWSLSQKKVKKQIALALGYRSMLNNAAALHLLNVDEEALIAPLELRCRKFIIPNGVYLEEIEPLPQPGKFRAQHPGIGDRPYVLFLGRLHYKKGLDYLIDSFTLLAPRFPDLQLVVAGPDDGEAANLQRAASDRGMSARVHIVGPLFGVSKIEAYVDAAVFCLPSRQEGFSVAVIESMACGTPVVISPACHFPEVESAGAGVVAPLNNESIAQAIGRLIETPETAWQMGGAGRKLVETSYTWSSIAEKSLECYRAVIPSRDYQRQLGG